MSTGSWLKALCLAILVVILIDLGFLVRVNSLSRETCLALAAMTAIAGLVPVVFAVYLIRTRCSL
ncbi:hypothetical protein [Nitrospira sp. Kam-Ns4a]